MTKANGMPITAGVRPSEERKSIRILIADDHPVVRRGLVSCLKSRKHVVIVGEAADGFEVIAKAKELLPDVVLMDIEMRKLDGLCAAETLHDEVPQIKIVFLSVHRPAAYSGRIIKSGVRGYISKQVSVATLIEAIETVAGGGTWFDTEDAKAIVAQWMEKNRPDDDEITVRERQVLVAVTEGLRNGEIASQLGLAIRTVESHLEHIKHKLHVRNVAGLTRLAIERGWIVWPQCYYENVVVCSPRRGASVI